MIIPSLTKEEKQAKRVNDSHGEYLVIQSLAEIAKEMGWIVYRSLRLENHPTKIEGEIDVIVFGEDIGIVLLEVKGSKIKCIDGEWSAFNRGQDQWVEIQDPFNQIKDASFAFRSEVKFLFDHFRVNPLISWGCVFPECDSITGTTSYPSWRFCLASQLDTIGDFLKSLAKRERNKLSNLERKNLGGIDSRTAYKILENIAPIRQEGQYIDPDYSELLLVLERETEAVNALVRSFSNNKFVIVEGGAGTGKTKAALFECKRLLNKGQSLLFVCRSLALAKSIERHLSNVFDRGNFMVLSFEQFKTNPPSEISSALIIDEAQDISADENFKNLLLSYKSKDAIVRIFGDFDCQNLNSDKQTFLDWLNAHAIHFSQFTLFTNCRNTIQIGEKIKNITDLDSSEFSLSSVNGEQLDFYTNISRVSLSAKINELCETWISRGQPVSGITVLRYDEVRELQDEEKLLEEIQASRFNDHFNSEYKGVLYSNVMEFKGLETPYLIFVVDFTDENWEKIFYIALSRARVKCQVIFLDTINSLDLLKMICKITGVK
jgi:hypothetical protein